MKIIIKQELRDLLDKYPLYSQINKGDEALVIAHFYSANFKFEAYVLESWVEEGKRYFYGYQSLGYGFEMGEIASLEEMEEINQKFSFLGKKMIALDENFKPCSVKEIKMNGLLFMYGDF